MRFYLHVLKSFAILAGGFVVGCGSGIKGDDNAAGAPMLARSSPSIKAGAPIYSSASGSLIKGVKSSPIAGSWHWNRREASYRSARTRISSALGYFPERPSKYNPDGLPIGFAKTRDPASGEHWMGPTCAACHTGQVKYRGKIIRVDGGADPRRFHRAPR